MIGNPDIKKLDHKKRLLSLFWGVFFILFFQLSQHLSPSVYLSEALYITDPNKSIMEEMINEGISSGESVILGKGIYKEPSLDIPIGVSLIGEDLGSVIISGDPNNPYNAVITVFSHSTIKNLVICNGRAGIYIPHQNNLPTDIIIEHNLIINNRNGIFLEAKKSKNIRIIGNTIANNQDRGILVLINPNQPDLLCKENIIAFNGKGIGIDFAQKDGPQNGFTDFIELTNISLDYNNIYDRLYRIWYYSDGTQRDSRIILNLNELGKGNFSQDPFFKDTNHGDYHLVSYSPCIDKGDPNSEYSQEPDNNGERINLGVFGNTPQAEPTSDTDNDGILDYHEGRLDRDLDDSPDCYDSDAVTIPLTLETDMISIQLQGEFQDANQNLKFEDTKAIPPSELPTNRPQGIIIFDVIQFRIINLNEAGSSCIRMILPKDKEGKKYSGLILNHLIQYMVLSSDSVWEPIPFEMDTDAFNKTNENAIFLNIDDGQKGDKDGTKNGVIEHMAALVIKPRALTDWKEPGGCFISIAHP